MALAARACAGVSLPSAHVIDRAGMKVWTPRPVPSHRWPGKGRLGCLALVAFCGIVSLLATFRVALREVAQQLGPGPSLGLVLLLVLGVPVGHRQLRLVGRRAAVRWGERNGWSVVVDRHVWPWERLPVMSGSVTVEFAIAGNAGGYPIMVGEVSWKNDGFDGVIGQPEGHGVFAVVTLQKAYGAASIRRRRSSASIRFEDEFDREYRILLEDVRMMDRFAAPAVKAAHVAEQVPPWMIVDDQLFAVVARRRALRPAAITDLTRRVLRLVKLLELPPPEGSDDSRDQGV